MEYSQNGDEFSFIFSSWKMKFYFQLIALNITLK